MKSSLTKFFRIIKSTVTASARVVAFFIVAPVALVMTLCGFKSLVKTELFNHARYVNMMETGGYSKLEIIVGYVAALIAFVIAIPLLSIVALIAWLVCLVSGLMKVLGN